MPIGVLSSYRFSPLYFSKCKYNSKGKSLVLRSFCPYRATFLLMYNPGCYPGLGASALSGRAGNRNSSHSLKPAIIDSGRAGNRNSGHSLKPAIIDSGRAGNTTNIGLGRVYTNLKISLGVFRFSTSSSKSFPALMPLLLRICSTVFLASSG